MTLNSFLALWVGFLGTLVHLCPLCPLLGTMQMPPWALVCTFMGRTSCDLLFLEYPAFTLRYQSPSVVRGIGLLGASLWPPSGLANSLVMEWRPMPFSAAASALTSLPFAKCVCLAHCSRGEHVAPHCAVAYIPPCLRMTMSSRAHWSLGPRFWGNVFQTRTH